jgi:selenide, water dikinase
LCGLKIPSDENLIVGMDEPDDAGIYKISENLALIQTLDFFTPIVDDPYAFGQIAAANSLSDVYAMGGIPKTAMNMVCFPSEQMDIAVLREILRGGLDKMIEAQVVLVGGHSVEDKELKYGLSVTGFIHPGRILTKRNIKPGSMLILTKPLGTGIINTAIKAGLATEKLSQEVIHVMAQLNRYAGEVMADFPVSACTDITGFGLAGHLSEMVSGSGSGMLIDSRSLPVFPEALEFASMGLIPAGAYKNRKFRESMVQLSSGIPLALADILFDPQTSGGLAISVNKSHAAKLLNRLYEKGITWARIIGEVVSGPEQIRFQ